MAKQGAWLDNKTIAGSTLFSTFMKLPHLDLFREVFRD